MVGALWVGVSTTHLLGCAEARVGQCACMFYPEEHAGDPSGFVVLIDFFLGSIAMRGTRVACDPRRTTQDDRQHHDDHHEHERQSHFYFHTSGTCPARSISGGYSFCSVCLTGRFSGAVTCFQSPSCARSACLLCDQQISLSNGGKPCS